MANSIKAQTILLTKLSCTAPYQITRFALQILQATVDIDYDSNRESKGFYSHCNQTLT